MSYILDALRKSESERHQGEVPNLGANPLLVHASRDERPLWPYLLIAVLVINAVIVSLWLLKPWDEDASAASVSSATTSHPVPTQAPQSPENSPVVATVSNPASAPQSSVGPYAGEGQQLPHGTVYSMPGAIPGAIAGGAAPVAVPGQNPGAVTYGAPTMPNGYAAQNIPPNGWGSATSPQGTATYPPQSQTMAPVQQSGGVGQPMLITPDSSRQSLSYAEPDPIYEEEALEVLPADTPAVEVPTLEQMPGSFRTSIPTLRFNSHIFSSDPSARRVMINNLYLREGQPFAGMLVQEITDEGVVLVKDGVMFEVNASRDWLND